MTQDLKHVIFVISPVTTPEVEGRVNPVNLELEGPPGHNEEILPTTIFDILFKCFMLKSGPLSFIGVKSIADF